MRVEKLKLIGMHCAACAVRIEKRLRSLSGVVDAEVHFAAEEGEVRYDPGKITLKDIVDSIRDVGYDVYKEEVYFIVQNFSSVDEEPVLEGKIRSLGGVIDVRASHAVRGISVVLNPLSVSMDENQEAYRLDGGIRWSTLKGRSRSKT